jgi:dihydrofolate reductase
LALGFRVFIATSLDGFIAREDGNLDWLTSLPDTGEDHGYEALMEAVDGLIMGRNTYEIVRGFGVDWPYSKPVVVMSRTLGPDDVPSDLKGRVEITGKGPEAIASELEERGWTAAYVDGGAVIRGFLAAGLVERLTLTRVPVILGKGIPLFDGTVPEVALALEESRAFPSGLVTSTYRVLRR